jgi:transposase, IS5 family
MRSKLDPQDVLEFNPASLKVTREYHEKYRVVDMILAETPAILNLFHRQVSKLLTKHGRMRRATFTSDQLLRAILVMEIEGLPYREAAVRIDDSHFLRRFVRVYDGPMMDYTLLCKAYKAVSPEAWKQMNEALGRYAIGKSLIKGEVLRADTTACETNIHFPTDATLLWDGYRTLSRLISAVREYDPDAVGIGRTQNRRVKRSMLRIVRKRNNTEGRSQELRRPYSALLAHVRRILDWSQVVQDRVGERKTSGRYDFHVALVLSGLVQEMKDYAGPIEQVLDQASRRVLLGEVVPNSEKLFSIFEPHTELLIRGKAGKQIEFGHMILIQEVENKFISGYDAFRWKPTDASLVDPILRSHQDTFGHLPRSFTADKGFYESMSKLQELERRIPHLSIAKKGKRTEEERDREHRPLFRALQRFRAGIEGTISALKRAFKMSRCLYRSFRTYCGSIGAHVLAHNLVVVARLL